MKKNYSAIIFSMAFLLILIRRWDSIQCIDRAFYFVAIVGFFILAICLNFNKVHKNSWIDRRDVRADKMPMVGKMQRLAGTKRTEDDLRRMKYVRLSKIDRVWKFKKKI